jgi:conjugal transfer pilus assembly protein TraV
MRKPFLAILAISLVMAGCSTTGFTGLDADNKFKCKAPEGVSCTSVSGVYANASQKKLPSQAGDSPSPAPGASSGPAGPAQEGGTFSPKDLTTPTSGDPIRIPPLVLRVWIAPWEDVEGDLHDQHYVYALVRDGRWMIEANQERIREEFKPLFPLKSNKHDDPADSAANAAANAEAVVGGGVEATSGGMPK